MMNSFSSDLLDLGLTHSPFVPGEIVSILVLDSPVSTTDHTITTSTTTSTTAVDSRAPGAINNADDTNDDVQDMDWEPSPDVAIYHQGVSLPTLLPIHLPVKSKSRVSYVVRRTNPLYWQHSLLMFDEFKVASKIRFPGRSFLSAGRALLTTIPEVRVPGETSPHADEAPVTTVPVVQKRRRSTRLAKRRQLLKLQNQLNHYTIHAGVSVPEALGSVFVNGRRCSARHLTRVKSS